MISFSINPVSLIRTLSMALELAVDGVNMHHWRTALISQGIADEMGISRTDQQVLLAAALMHDIGAAPSMDERQQLLDPGQEAILGRRLYSHAEEGFLLLKDSLCFADTANIVRSHHDCWEGGNPTGLSHESIPLESRIIHLADRIDVLLDKSRPVLSQCNTVRAFIQEGRGGKFDPLVVDAFLKRSQMESFWLDMVNTGYVSTFFNQMDAWGQSSFTVKQVLNIAELYATLIDRMSIFTATHSRSVSGVAVLLAQLHGFCGNEIDMMRMAGLLHDLGKLSIPNSILEKPGKLDEREMRIMRQHTYYTYRILEQIDNMETIAQWAAFHHETLDGQGYPFKVQSEGLPLGSRIMAVADIFVALAENRPYRERLGKEAVHKIMSGMVANKKIDGRIVETLFDQYRAADDVVLAHCQTDPACARAV